MSNLVPFDENSNLPAHFQAAQGMPLNDAAEEFASIKFAVLSVKNSRFHIKRDGDTTMILRPKTNKSDEDEPATYIDVAILNLQKSKAYYATGYTPGAEEKPDCFSNDGITPDASSQDIQCTTCALCPNNVWGTGTNDKGEATKGKACSDVQRVAISAVDDMDSPMMLRVPPASLRNLAEMSKMLSKKGVPLNGVVTRITFDAEATGVVLLFKPVGYLDAASFAKAQSKMNDDLVLAIVGKSNRHTALPPPAAEQHGVHGGEGATLPKAKPAKAKPAPVVVDPAVAELAAKKAKKDAAIAKAKADLEALEAEDADPEPVPTVKAKTTVAAAGTFDQEIEDLLK